MFSTIPATHSMPIYISYQRDSFNLSDTKAQQNEVRKPIGAVKRVSFDLAATISFSCSDDLLDKHFALIWYDHEEYKNFKLEASSLAKAMSVETRTKGQSSSYKRVMLQLYDYCVKATGDPGDDVLSETVRRRIQRFMTKDVERIGLERMSIRNLRNDKIIRREEISDLVISLQQSPMFSNVAKAEMIRINCERISQPSRCFAQIIAESLHGAIKADETMP